jgi:uncharacterized protein YjcR
MRTALPQTAEALFLGLGQRRAWRRRDGWGRATPLPSSKASKKQKRKNNKKIINKVEKYLKI